MAASAKLSAIMVRGVASNISRDTLENFFENRKRSGGGAIADIVFDPQEQTALIQFEDEEVVERVLKQSAPEISGTKLQITKAQAHELELLRVLWVVNLPPSVTEENLTYFFESRKRCSGGDVEQVELRTDRRQARVTFAESSVAQRVFNHGQMVLNKVILQVRRHLGDPEMSTGPRTSQRYRQPQSGAMVVEETVEFPRESVKKDSILLSSFQVKYLKASNFVKEVTCMMPNLSVVINEKEGLLELEGLEREVDKVQVKVLKLIHSLLNQKEMLSGAKLKLLSSQEAFNHITSLFEANEFCAVWNIHEKNLILYASSRPDLDKAVLIINSQICETKTELKEAAQDLLETQAWKRFEESLITKYNGLIAIEVSSRKNFVNVGFVKDKCESCVSAINNFFERNAVITTVIRDPPTAVKALTSAWESKLQDIALDHQVSINVSDKSNIQIEGQQERVAEAEDKIKSLLTSITIQECEISCYDWMQSSIGGWALQGIQNKMNVFITGNGDKEPHVLVICGWHEPNVGAAIDIVQKFATAAADQETSLKELQKEMSTLKNQNSSKETSLKEKEQTIKELQKEMSALKNKNSSNETSLNEKEHTIKELQKETSTLKNQNSSKDFSLEESQRTIEIHQKEITTLKDQITAQNQQNAQHQAIWLYLAQAPIQVLYQQDFPGGLKVHICEGDITTLKVDAVVNAANERLTHAGGVSRAISKAAGPRLNQESQDYIRIHGILNVGEVVFTTAGKMKSGTVIHAVGPIWNQYTNKQLCEQELLNTFVNVFDLAEKKKLKSVAVPAVSSGVSGVPKLVVAKALYDAIHFFDSATSNKQRSLLNAILITLDPDMNQLLEFTFKKGGKVDTKKFTQTNSGPEDGAAARYKSYFSKTSP